MKKFVDLRALFDYYSETNQYKMREAIALIEEAAANGDPFAAHLIYTVKSHYAMLEALEIATGEYAGCYQEISKVRAVLQQVKEGA